MPQLERKPNNAESESIDAMAEKVKDNETDRKFIFRVRAHGDD